MFQQRVKRNSASQFYGDGKITEKIHPNKFSIFTPSLSRKISYRLHLTFRSKKLTLALLILGFLLNFRALGANELKISSINFSGNNKIRSAVLKNSLNLKSGDIFSYNQLNEKVKNLLNLYKKRGYYFTKITTPRVTPAASKGKVDVNIHIEEGNRVEISKIEFVGNKYFSNEKLINLMQTEEDKTFSPLILNNDVTAIADLYAEKGYPFCKIVIRNLVLENNTISVVLEIDENDLVRVSNLVFEGNEISRDNALSLMLNFRENEIYKQSRIDQARRNLLRKKYITTAEIVPLDKKNLLVKIKEKSMNDFHGVLGLSPDSENSIQERLTGFVDFSFMNIFGTAREVHLLWEKLRNKSYKVDLSYREPFLFASQTSAQLSLNRRNVDTIFVKTDAKIALDYQLPDYNHIGISYLISNSLLDTVSTNRKGVGLHFTYENIYHPTKINSGGYNLEADYEIIWKSKRSYRQQIQANVNYILPLTPQSNIFFQATNHSIFTSHDSLTVYDLFQFGGYENLRGFTNNQFRAKKYSLLTTEYRYLLSPNSRVFLFTDYCLSDAYNALLSIGFGLRLKTKIGLLKMDYGIGHQEEEWANPLQGTIHFGLETGF